MRKDTIGNAGHRPGNITTPEWQPNPFQETLASQAFQTNAAETGESSGNGTPNAVARATRPHYDVDDFKRLLMTGERSVPETSTSSTPSTHSHGIQNVGDSSSNTDTSSISRHSIFEPLPGVSQETPRTSYEVSPSGDERQLPLPKTSPQPDRIRPAAPKSRHGNLTPGNVPQSMPFRDPNLSVSPSSKSQEALPRWPAPSSPRTSTDLNKPLPLPPGADSLGELPQGSASVTSMRPQSEIFDSSGLQFNSPPSKRDPPAPPLARRHSQLRPKSFLGPSARSTRISEENLVDARSQPQHNPASLAEPPPPPPPRRSGLTRTSSTASTSSSVSGLRATSAVSIADDDNTKFTKSPPPVPPSRTPSISSAKRPPRLVSIVNTSPTTAPPPPPRRRGSSQSSLTQPKSAGDYRPERSRGNSGASSILAAATIPSGPAIEDKDVLADLTALQREVDELRGKLK